MDSRAVSSHNSMTAEPYSSMAMQRSGQFWTASHAWALQAVGHLVGQQHAVAFVVGVEQLGGQGVAPTVAGAQFGVEDDAHGRSA